MKILLMVIGVIAVIQTIIINYLLNKINALNQQIRTKERQLNYHRAMNKGRW